ncbi:MAG: type 1 glutamine amidotransferase [Archaeoglobus sp.]|nr:type 1 glutamine amidotransferase [Archaeoglobus sp.]
MKFLKALFLLENDFEDLEFFYPYYRLKEEGIEVVVASSDRETKIGKHGYTITPDLIYSEVIPEEYAALVIPGGKSPERVRVNEEAVEIVRKFADKVIAAICHGPQLLISAGLVEGRKLTSWIGIRDDVKAAGGIYEDREVVIDGKIITSRMPDDLPAFCREILKKLGIRK